MANPPLLFAAHGRALAQLHTALSAASFAVALAVGLTLHYRKIVKNQYYGYPQEWFPSVSATIGDWFPERNLFQLLIALTSGPRFLLILVSYLAHRQLRPTSHLPGTLAVVGVLRALMCGGWVFVTSTDHGDVHDVCMVSYIVLNLPYMILHTILTPKFATRAKSLRRWLGSSFFAALIPLVYYYLQHKQHRVPGAYSIYALVEWSLIILDVAFDSIAILDFPDSDPAATDPTTTSAPNKVLQISISLAEKELFSAGQRVHLAPTEGGSMPRTPGRIEKAFAKVELATAGTRHFAADIYLGYLFWTSVTALGPMIFYSAVWAMGLSGDEILLFCCISPFLLSLPPLRRLFARPSLGNLGALIGIASVFAGDTDGESGASEGEGTARLRWTASGVAMATMGMVAGWWEVRTDDRKLENRTTTLLLGLVLSNVVKFANFSLNPLWPFMRSSTDPKLDNGGWNTFGLVVGILAYLDTVTRRPRATVPAAASSPSEAKPSPSFLGTVGAVIGFTSSFFLLHWLFTDSGTIIAWSFDGYPSSGPFAFPHGLLTISALSLGVVLSPLHLSTRIASSLLAYGAACGAAALLYSQTYWAAFFPGCLLGIYAISTFPALLSSLLFHSPRGPALTFGSAFFLYVVLQVASTWPVAYAFVPAGWILRERTDIIVGVVMGGIGLGVFALPRVQDLSPSRAVVPTLRPSRALSKRINGSILCLLLAGTVILIYRAPGYFAPGVPYRAEERVVTAAIWTVHFGLDGRMWESQRRMANFMREAEVDVIGLLETDNHRIVGGNRELTQWMAHSLNMPYTDLGPGPHKNTWGCVLISKYPILRSSRHLLPSPHGELAPAIHATLDVYGTEVDVVVAHNGQEEDPLDRELQSRELGRIMKSRWPRPTIFLGYLVTTPHAERPAPYKFVTEDAKMLDIAPKDSDRWCQYILYRGLHRVGYARLNRGSDPSVTDSEVQLGKFVVPLLGADGSSYTIKAEAAFSAIRSSPDFNASDPSQLRVPPIPIEEYLSHLHSSPAPLANAPDQTIWTPERYMPESLHFPKQFYGEGVNGHRYIVLTGQMGEEAPNYFMRDDEKEWRRLQEMEDLQQQANGCPVQ
ncbi:hypothetical protein JCM10908_002572 [Rhodotorula pacifica]|uniref:Cwh43p n=1 Tax=Rhodotorula pacifica TaxID=1495444 RepID=UPI0031748947